MPILRCRLFLLFICITLAHSFTLAQKQKALPVKRIIDTTFCADTTQKFVIADININGNKRTKSYIVLREVTFRQGDTLSVNSLQNQMQRAREQLMNTALFIEVAFYVTRRQDSLLYLQLDVKERWYFFPLPYFELIDRNFNDWWVTHNHSLKRVNYGVDFKQRNLSGRRDDLSLRLINGYNQQINLGYSQPYANKNLTKGFSVGFSYGRQHEINYRTSLNKQIAFREEDKYVRRYIGFGVGYTYRPGIRSYYSVGFNLTHDSYHDTILKINPNFLPNGRHSVTYPQFSASYSYVNVDYSPYPTRGFSANASITKRGFNKNMDLWSFFGAAAYTKPITRKSQIRLTGAFNVKLPLDQPYYNSGLLGYGALAMRGMEYYVVDGVVGAAAGITLRHEILSFIFKNPLKIKNHERIPFKFMFKVFNDFGYAYSKNEGNSRFNNRLLRTYGMGIDVLSIYDWVFTIEYSFDAAGKGNLIYHN